MSHFTPTSYTSCSLSAWGAQRVEVKWNPFWWSSERPKLYGVSGTFARKKHWWQTDAFSKHGGKARGKDDDLPKAKAQWKQAFIIKVRACHCQCTLSTTLDGDTSTSTSTFMPLLPHVGTVTMFLMFLSGIFVCFGPGHQCRRFIRAIESCKSRASGAVGSQELPSPSFGSSCNTY